MSKFKKIGSLFLALISVFILTACGHVQKDPDTSDKTVKTTVLKNYAQNTSSLSIGG